MRALLRSRITALILALSLTAVLPAGAKQPVSMKIPAPEFQGINEWINSKPLTLKDLRGKVVVVHFWTFG